MAANLVSISEYKCAICLQLLIEPVVLPCKHEMCRPCFRKNVEQANFVCPMCRKRIASWARKCIREGTLVDQKRWNLIQKLFPEKTSKRLLGDDDDSDDELYQPVPKRVFAKTGELRQEYEKEMNKITQLQEQEEQASKDMIENILEEEKAHQLQREMQEENDEKFARRISTEKQTQENKESTSKHDENGVKSTTVSSRSRTTDTKKKKLNSKGTGRSYTLERYFLSNDKQPGHPSQVEESNVSSEQRYKSDYEFAMALQKQFDEEIVDANKRDEYMLRKSKPDKEEREFIQEEQAGERRNSHTNNCEEEEVRGGGKLFHAKGESTRSDKEKVKIKANTNNTQLQLKEMKILRDRTILNASGKLDE